MRERTEPSCYARGVMVQPRVRSIVKRLALAVLVLFVLLQFVPRGRGHSNPPVTGEPPWDSPATRETFMLVCGDCHSNETQWPWYSHVAPISWLVEEDVEDGRGHFNVSAWDEGPGHADEAAEEYGEGEMPLWFYTPLHPSGVLSPEDRGAFIEGLKATFGGEEHEAGEHEAGE